MCSTPFQKIRKEKIEKRIQNFQTEIARALYFELLSSSPNPTFSYWGINTIS